MTAMWMASAVTGYARFLGEQLKRQQRGTSAHVGEIGKRIDLVVTIERVSSVDTEYGTLMINSMRTAEGAIIVWKTGRTVGAVGETIKLRGTVKRHSEYRGEAQTEMSRCSIG